MTGATTPQVGLAATVSEKSAKMVVGVSGLATHKECAPPIPQHEELYER